MKAAENLAGQALGTLPFLGFLRLDSQNRPALLQFKDLKDTGFDTPLGAAVPAPAVIDGE